eukprot:8539083-Lingulodinium_polyedra.AAC.1
MGSLKYESATKDNDGTAVYSFSPGDRAAAVEALQAARRPLRSATRAARSGQRRAPLRSGMDGPDQPLFTVTIMRPPRSG